MFVDIDIDMNMILGVGIKNITRTLLRIYAMAPPPFISEAPPNTTSNKTSNLEKQFHLLNYNNC